MGLSWDKASYQTTKHVYITPTPKASADAYKLIVGEMDSNPGQFLSIQPSIKQLVHEMALLSPFSTASQ